MYQFFKSEWFNFEFVRLLGFAPYEGGEIAEIFEAAAKVKDQNPESWYSAWIQAGEKAEAIAEEAQRSGDRIAARRAYLRASNYVRAAQFMLNSRPGYEDARVLPTIERAIADFKQGIKLLDGNVHLLDIPYENNITLPGYLYLPPASRRLPGEIPVFVNSGGGDSTQEELFFINPTAGIDLGYAVLTFEGPGQGIVLRRDKLPLRPDWEVVTGRVLDYLYAFAKEHPELELDLDRVALAGASMGGYFVLRGAIDPRVKACISIDPFYSMMDLLKLRMPALLVDSFVNGYISDGVWNGLIGFMSLTNYQVKWEMSFMKWALGQESAAAIMRGMQGFTLQRPDGSEYLHSVKCPVFVTGAAASHYNKPHLSTTRIYNTLVNLKPSQKKEWISSDAAEGGLQAKVGAFGISAQRTFAWLDEQFKVDRRLSKTGA